MEESGEDEDDDEEDGTAHARNVFVVFEVGQAAIVGACEEHGGCLLEKGVVVKDRDKVEVLFKSR